MIAKVPREVSAKMSAPTKKPSAQQSKWLRPVLAIAGALLLLLILVLLAKWFTGSTAGQSFLHDYPGRSELPADAPVGIPAWLGWQLLQNLPKPESTSQYSKPAPAPAVECGPKRLTRPPAAMS